MAQNRMQGYPLPLIFEKENDLSSNSPSENPFTEIARLLAAPERKVPHCQWPTWYDFLGHIEDGPDGFVWNGQPSPSLSGSILSRRSSSSSEDSSASRQAMQQDIDLENNSSIQAVHHYNDAIAMSRQYLEARLRTDPLFGQRYSGEQLLVLPAIGDHERPPILDLHFGLEHLWDRHDEPLPVQLLAVKDLQYVTKRMMQVTDLALNWCCNPLDQDSTQVVLKLGILRRCREIFLWRARMTDDKLLQMILWNGLTRNDDLFSKQAYPASRKSFLNEFMRSLSTWSSTLAKWETILENIRCIQSI